MIIACLCLISLTCCAAALFCIDAMNAQRRYQFVGSKNLIRVRRQEIHLFLVVSVHIMYVVSE